MLKAIKRKIVILLVSFALANIALHAIINFHFYRIFNQELVKIEKNFIKKDDAEIHISPVDADKSFQNTFLSHGVILSSSTICTTKYGDLVVRPHPIASQILQRFSTNSPSRGSPQQYM
ncbi:MAG: hypothetical protein JXR34_09350 [Bacteroidales bacterium]|nr:hypothetical protein [Bacteroidales bacterium]